MERNVKFWKCGPPAFPLMTPCASGSRMARTCHRSPAMFALKYCPIEGAFRNASTTLLRQIAVLVVDRVAPDDHVPVRLVVADPLDEAAPGDVLAVERLEIDRSAISHVNALGFPGRGEEQGDDESEAGHGRFALARAQGCCAFSEAGIDSRLRRSSHPNLIPITSPCPPALASSVAGQPRLPDGHQGSCSDARRARSEG